ncbi:hypothetical protein C0J52_20184 [Blattella germanica]|nr:hypothetical protein C0J52_20184 [Blattella germanica]
MEQSLDLKCLPYLIINFDVEELSYKTIAHTIIVAILTKQGNIIFHNKRKKYNLAHKNELNHKRLYAPRALCDH